MRRHHLILLTTGLLLPRASLATATVTLALASARDGEIVPAASIIDWTVSVSVSRGDNDGLALVCVDLVQDASNPALFDIPPGTPGSIDPIMQNFSRPLGIGNPGENGADTGYIGLQRGESGEKNLVQIGGAQNTFGLPGERMGLSAVVIPGVGQGAQPQVVLSGSFPAPSEPGTYVFRLENAYANVLEEHYDPPLFSPVAVATIDFQPQSISFTVADCPGDLDRDGDTDQADLGILLADWGCTGDNCAGDLDGDGRTDQADLGILLADWACGT